MIVDCHVHIAADSPGHGSVSRRLRHSIAFRFMHRRVADPRLLEPALRRGVTVIAAHCATRATLWDTDYLPEFVRLAREHERLFGDTAALNLPTRSYAYRTLLRDPEVRSKLVHGSDWPILSVPPVRVGWHKAL